MQTPDRVIEVKLEPLVETLTAAVVEFSKQSQAQFGVPHTSRQRPGPRQSREIPLSMALLAALKISKFIPDPLSCVLLTGTTNEC